MWSSNTAPASKRSIANSRMASWSCCPASSQTAAQQTLRGAPRCPSRSADCSVRSEAPAASETSPLNVAASHLRQIRFEPAPEGRSGRKELHVFSSTDDRGLSLTRGRRPQRVAGSLVVYEIIQQANIGQTIYIASIKARDWLLECRTRLPATSEDTIPGSSSSRDLLKQFGRRPLRSPVQSVSEPRDSWSRLLAHLGPRRETDAPMSLSAPAIIPGGLVQTRASAVALPCRTILARCRWRVKRLF